MTSGHFLLVVLLVALGALVENQVDGCSCLPSHPQDQYCSSDFVIVARIRRVLLNDRMKVYKAKIKKEFKMSEKAAVALKHGRIVTALEDSMCGVDLEVGKVYLLTGRVMGLQAQISLCGFAKPWRQVTARQRKGFRLIYSRGCDCTISYFYHIPGSKDRCSWDNMICQQDHGICLRSPNGHCHWSKSIDLKKCLTGEKSEVLKPTPKVLETSNRAPYLDPVKDQSMAANNYKYHYRPRRGEEDRTS